MKNQQPYLKCALQPWGFYGDDLLNYGTAFSCSIKSNSGLAKGMPCSEV